MSKFDLSKASAILIGLSILATSVNTAFARDPKETTSARRPVRINITAIENKIASMREKLASKEAILKARLQTFKDQKKATAAARISTNLNRINQNQTTQMQKHLDLMSTILDKLEARVNKGTPDIKDPDKAKTAIAVAREAISTASAAVSDQAQKDYTIQVTSESRIRIDAKTQRDNLHRDLQATRKLVQNAKQAVANAIRIAKSGALPANTRLEKEGSPSGQ